MCVVFCGAHVMFCIIRSGDLSCYVWGGPVNKYMFMWTWKMKSILEGQGFSLGWPQFVLVGWAKVSILNVKICTFMDVLFVHMQVVVCPFSQFALCSASRSLPNSVIYKFSTGNKPSLKPLRESSIKNSSPFHPT